MSRPQGFPKRVVDLIWARDESCCAWCGRGHIQGNGTAQIHHRRPRGSGGTSLAWVNRAANGVLLCTECHGEIERERVMASRMGFLVSANGVEPASHVPIRHGVHGLCLLSDDGQVHGQEVVF